jgi:hypothetical protein
VALFRLGPIGVRVCGWTLTTEQQQLQMQQQMDEQLRAQREALVGLYTLTPPDP